ncbi:MAG: hypothetical protein L3K23_01775 [Thermoplasmata archaeon]|nr:hypothetical protein [Thermoplasmata archaeon]
MTEPWPSWPDPEPSPPRPTGVSPVRSARWAVLTGGALLAGGVLLETLVLWFLAGYFGPTGTFAFRLSIFYDGLGGSYAVQGLGILIGALGWATREPRERRSRGPGPDPTVARRWRAGRALAIAGGVSAAAGQLFNAATLLSTSALEAPQRFVLLTPEVQILPSLMLGVGIVLFALGWWLRRTPEPAAPPAAA